MSNLPPLPPRHMDPEILTQTTCPIEMLMDNYPDGNPKSAAGAKKPQLHTIPPTAMLHLAVVMGLGAQKYGAFNWRETGVAASVYVSAAQRHLLSWFDGESIDPESGASHLAHVMACMAIVLDAMENGTLKDDRPMPGRTAEMVRQFAEAGRFAA